MIVAIIAVTSGIFEHMPRIVVFQKEQNLKQTGVTLFKNLGDRKDFRKNVAQ